MVKPIAACLSLAGMLYAAPLARPYMVDHYSLRLQPDFAAQRLRGEVQLQLHSTVDTAFTALELDAGGLEIKLVTDGKVSQYFDRHGEVLVVVLTEPLQPGEHRTLSVQYQASPAPGLKFFPDQIYTSSSPGDWLVCNDRPDDRATLHLEIVLPEGSQAAASGVSSGASAWDLDPPAPVSLFGFAVGSFAGNNSASEGVKLPVLGPATPPWETTAAALRYFAERAGKPYPGPSYTQVFVHGEGTASFAGGLTLLPDSYKPDNPWLLANQLARQWYGVAIVPADWSDRWLSDGLSAFLADTFLEQRYGKERYQREIEASRQTYQVLRREGKDRSLSYPDWRNAQDADGPIPAQKGVCFLYLLRSLMGEGPFWNGLRRYTAEQWRHPVASEDFQTALAAAGNMERDKNSKGSAKSLGQLFDQWVYGLAAAGKK